MYSKQKDKEGIGQTRWKQQERERTAKIKSTTERQCKAERKRRTQQHVRQSRATQTEQRRARVNVSNKIISKEARTIANIIAEFLCVFANVYNYTTDLIQSYIIKIKCYHRNNKI